MESPRRPWFKRRTYGYGWTPITWEGWLVTLASLGVVLAINAALVIHFRHG